MTYMPDRDRDGIADTADDRPRVMEDDGRMRTADDATATDLSSAEARAAERQRLADEAAAARTTPATPGVRRIDPVVASTGPTAGTVLAREHAAFGGIKWGSAFFGWLTAMGLAVLLTSIVAAAGTALGLANDVTSQDAADNASTIGTAGAAAVLVIMFLAYFAGGYVAGRMARFDGARQGFAVWVWALVFALVIGITATVIGSQYDVLGTLNTFPRVPNDTSALSTAGLFALVLALLVSLIGAVLGGRAGMNYHRRVDAAGYGDVDLRTA